MHRLALCLILVAAALLWPAGTRACCRRRAVGGATGHGCSRPIPNSSSASTAANSSGATARACRSTTARATSRSRNGWSIPTSPTCSPSPIRPGREATPPAANADPGRARNAAFFDKVYGDCRAGEVEKNLETVAWLPKRTKQRLPFNKRQRGGARARRGERRARRIAGVVRCVPHPVGRHLQLPRHRRHRPRLRARPRASPSTSR